MKKKILVIEDDKHLSMVIQKNLSKIGYETYAAFDEEGGYNRSTQDKFALIICDIALPSNNKLNPKSGFGIVDKIRNSDLQIPIIMITDNISRENEKLSYQYGANIFHKKPIDFEILCIQARKLIENYKYQPEIAFGDMVIDPLKGIFKKDEVVIELTRKEFILMQTLLSAPGVIFTRKEILSKYITRTDSEEKSVDVLVSRLRNKLGKYKGDDIIETVHSKGFRLSLKYLD